ncbi:FtsW/RodA/SpoVE family cell cycle protein, partial [Mycobacterium sp. THU-M116]
MDNALTRLLGRGKKAESAETGPTADMPTPDTADADTGKLSSKANADVEKFAPHHRFGAWLNRPMASFHLIIAIAGLLTTLGLIMVLSASGVRSYDSDGSAWVIFGKQVLWTTIGLGGAYVALRMPVRLLRRVAFTGYLITVILLVLVLVPGIGNLANGSRKWFVVGGLSMQPSELAKIALA